VRKEVLTAVTRMNFERAQNLVMRFVYDPDPELGGIAAEWLGTTKVQRALPGLVQMLDTERKQLLKEPERMAGMIAAVGDLGGEAEMELLGGLVPRTWLSFGRGRDDVVLACDKAISQIKKRLEGGETSQGMAEPDR